MGDVVDSATKHRGSSEKYTGESIHQGKYVDKMYFSPSNCGSPSSLMYLRGCGGWMWCKGEMAVVVDGAMRMYVDGKVS